MSGPSPKFWMVNPVPLFALTSVSGNVDIGRISGREIKRLLEEKNGSASGKVLQVLGDPGDNYTLDIQIGFEEVIADFPDIEVITDAALNWEASNAADIVENELLANPDIELIFSHAAHLSDAVRSVLETHPETYAEVLADHFSRHLEALRAGM